MVGDGSSAVGPERGDCFFKSILLQSIRTAANGPSTKKLSLMQTPYCVILAMIIFCSCSAPGPVTDGRDYAGTLGDCHTMHADNDDSEIAFWSGRLSKRPNDVTARIGLADAYASRFDRLGKLSDLHVSDSIYKSLLEHPAAGRAGLYQKLALNAMTRHDFPGARDFIAEALKTGDRMTTSWLILSDVEFERGLQEAARHALEKYNNKNAFAYLVRHSKLLDRSGDLKGAIRSMEKAYERIAGNRALASWTLSTLADMYGHAGRIRDAYNAYLKVLDKDPEYTHALKGIAWIAISHDRKTDDARAIVSRLLCREKRMPELNLMMAEIASIEGKVDEMKDWYSKFMEATSDGGYNALYARSRAIVAADHFGDAGQCISIAQKEIVNRPSAQSYDLLAWGYYRTGQYEAALAIVNEYIRGDASEPEIMYHTGLILKTAGHRREGRRLLDEALAGSFELGPVITSELMTELNK